MYGKICSIKYISEIPVDFPYREFFKSQPRPLASVVEAWPWVALPTIGDYPELRVDFDGDMYSGELTVVTNLLGLQRKKIILLVETKENRYLVGLPQNPVIGFSGNYLGGHAKVSGESLKLVIKQGLALGVLS